MLLTNRIAVVSGVGPGMGRDIALALSREGAALALGARRPRYLDSVAEEIKESGGQVVTLPTDIENPADCDELARLAVEVWGGIDILVNNAAHGGTYAPLVGTDPERLRRVVDVNLVGTLNMTNAIVPHLRSRGGGRIIMINTNVSEVVVEQFGVYGLSKSALAHATRHLAHELGPDGIRVNSVLPGAIWGDGLKAYFKELAVERGVPIQEIISEQAATNSLGYLPPSSEIAGTVVYLASDLSLPVTGQAIRVDCGQWSTARNLHG